MRPTARSLILDLLSTLRRGSAPVRALVEAGALFGIAGNSVRVALARLLADGLLDRDERGRYRLGAAARPVNERIASWRERQDRLVSWSGDWIGVHTGGLPGGDTRRRRQRARALGFVGFRPLAPGLEVRPNNLRGGVAGVREQLQGLGLEPEAAVFRLDDLDAETARRALALFDGEALGRRYRELRERIEASTERLGSLPREEAMIESFLLGGEAIRVIVLDPLLPDPVAPDAERRALIDSMQRYDRLGRRCWTGWLGEALADPDRSPAGVRGAGSGAEIAQTGGGV